MRNVGTDPLRCDVLKLPDTRAPTGADPALSPLTSEITAQLSKLVKLREGSSPMPWASHYASTLQTASGVGDMKDPVDMSWLAPGLVTMESKATDLQVSGGREDGTCR